MFNPRLEYPPSKTVKVPAFLDNPHKDAVFYVDLVKSGRAHVVSEFRDSTGTCHRLECWLGEDDSVGWTDLTTENEDEQEDD